MNELELLTQALTRLDQAYLQRDQDIEAHLNALALQVEQLARHVNTLSTQVSALAAQLTRFQDGLPK